MLAQLELYASQRTLDQILKPMTGLGHDVDSRERDDISQIEWADFIHGMNEVITAHYDVNDLQVHLPDVPLRKLQYEQLKVGFGGTTWRSFANASWILTNCGVRRIVHLQRILTDCLCASGAHLCRVPVLVSVVGHRGRRACDVHDHLLQVHACADDDGILPDVRVGTHY